MGDPIDLIPLKKVREILGVSRVTLWRWVSEGKLAAVRLSEKKIYIERHELERFIQSGKKTE